MGERLLLEGERMAEEELIIGYDNGGGQSGVRENPYYPAYEKLLGSYAKAIATMKDVFGDQSETETQNLEALRARFKVAK